jgi:hypothetical protein
MNKKDKIVWSMKEQQSAINDFVNNAKKYNQTKYLIIITLLLAVGWIYMCFFSGIITDIVDTLVSSFVLLGLAIYIIVEAIDNRKTHKSGVSLSIYYYFDAILKQNPIEEIVTSDEFSKYLDSVRFNEDFYQIITQIRNLNKKHDKDKHKEIVKQLGYNPSKEFLI